MGLLKPDPTGGSLLGSMKPSRVAGASLNDDALAGEVLRIEEIKRPFDIAFAAIGFALTAPLILLTALLIRATMGRPVLFRQKRAGLGGAVFEVCKFRTMHEGSEPDEKRLTRVGRFLRAYSIDELPQLWNVLHGEMSLVGPRPLVVQYLPLYSRRQQRRHEVRPGITGWAQVSGRNSLPWSRKFELDCWYVKHWSLWLDLKILALTALRVIRTAGISEAGHATMEAFRGNAPESPATPNNVLRAASKRNEVVAVLSGASAIRR